MSGETDTLVAKMQKSFGLNAAKMGGLQKQLKSIPTGSLALDYELGTGGWPIGYLCGVFGPRDIGKSSMIGFNAVRNAQAMGLNCAWIAVEPVGDDNWESWAILNGINVDDLLITWPDHGKQAFDMLHEILRSKAVDLVVFDSIGAILHESEMAEGGQARQGGQAGLITWGVKVAAPLAHKNECSVLLLNHVRHVMAAGVTGLLFKQPGGEALEHSESIIVQLKRGSNKFISKEDGVDITVGNEIVAVIQRNKLSQGTGRKAVFNYFHAESEQYPFGIDAESDIINTAMRTGVIHRGGSTYTLPNGQKFKGKDPVFAYLSDHPDTMTEIREGVMRAMLNRGAKAEETKLEVVNG